ncbi:histidinol dehydrogenase [Rosistilla ulvae]|uniref:histidinol dehydrogenase n=1 Tax=Rosistilla ulvae TaxID=1930277 RepID=UPI0037047E26
MNQPISINIPLVDARNGAAPAILDQLRAKLSPAGDVVSPKGRELTQKVFGEPLAPAAVVDRICNDIQRDGDTALLRYCQALDGADLDAASLRVPAAELQQAHAAADPEFLQCIRRIAENIRTFQSAILHQDVTITPKPGVNLTQRYVPLRRIGVCVPGGAAAYPSTVLMTVVPAQVAGVGEIAVVAPPTKFGSYNNDILATCHELGVTEVYRMGGAQAVAAMAFGTDTVPAVDKIVGPGNLFVALAKKQVYGDVDIDSIAGPSEVIVIADETANPAHVAADLLSQAEHSPGSAILISWSQSLLDATLAALGEQLATLERSDLTLPSLEAYGALILVDDREQARQMTDAFAPEHLHIQCESARQLATSIRNAGATFIGNHTPVALGDYAAGPSHVLPTSGTARWAAGLSSNDFVRSGSMIEFDQTGLENIADDVELLATKEGLTAHRRSISIRR